MRTTLSGYETQGEKQLYYRFRDKLSDDYHVWHNIHLLKARTEVDFIILHPAEGIYVLEVKDWPIEIIINADAHRAYIDKSGRTENLQNPITQARQNSFAIRNNLIRDPRMVHKEGPHKDQLVVPVNYGAVFPNITIQQLLDKGLDAWFPLQYTLDQEFTRGQSYTDQDIEKALGHLRDRKFYPLLGEQQWNAINELLGTPVVVDPISSDPIGVFDDNQEKLVSFKIDKQILIEGPAGSGKSLVLIKRALFMQNANPNWKIGIFCFNVVMSAYLQALLEQESEDHNMIVTHFNGISDLEIEPKSLDAVLIDEGQDINEDDFRKIVPLLANLEAPLTIFYDPRQSIYSSLNLPDLLDKYGIIIENQKELVRQQRSVHILMALAFHTFYNNPEKTFDYVITEVASVTERFFQGYSNPLSALSSGVSRHFSDSSINAQFYDEIKNRVLMKNKDSFIDIMDDIIHLIKEEVELEKANYRDFMLIYPTRHIGRYYLPTAIKRLLMESEIPFRVIDKRYGSTCSVNSEMQLINENDNRNSVEFNDDVVNLLTVHHAKGLDANYLFIIGFDNIEKFRDDTLENTLFEADFNKNRKIADLGYVALSRAKEKCFIYYREKNEAVEILEEILESF